MASLVDSWIPSLDGVEEKLRRGGKIADVGCGHGSSTLLMAQHFPDSVVHGFDFHEPSIEQARRKAAETGIRNAEFSVSAAKDIPAGGYDLACVFDALHDMDDPVGSARRIRDARGDALEENMHPLGGFSRQIRRGEGGPERVIASCAGRLCRDPVALLPSVRHDSS